MKLVGPFAFNGSTDQFTFYQSRYGTIVRRKTKAVDKHRIDTDPNLVTTKQNYTEFSHAARSAKLVRVAFRNLLMHAKNVETSNSFTGIMFSVIKSDVLNERGNRQASQGNLSLLERHEFNNETRVTNCINAPYKCSIDRHSGHVQIAFDSFIPRDALRRPKGATHFRIGMAAAELDFTTLSENHVETYSTLMSIDHLRGDNIVLSGTLTPGTKSSVIIALGLEFYERFGSTTSLIKPTGLAIVAASNA